jgi:hypothetical protein
VECHTEIANRISARKGLHATYHIPPGSSQECARCHSEHNGENFPLIKWDTKTFDHKETGYLLEGKHVGVECNKCHNPSRISPQERTTIKEKDLNRTYLGVSTACATCHEDFHKGRLGPTCQSCHNFVDWKSINVGQFDHSKTRYPLTGLHAQVQCAKCHTNGPDGKPKYVGIPFSKCSDCHQDPHHGSFPQGCASTLPSIAPSATPTAISRSRSHSRNARIATRMLTTGSSSSVRIAASVRPATTYRAGSLPFSP